MYAAFSARAVGLTLSAIETIDLAAWAGFPGVDLPIREQAQSKLGLAELRRRIADHGLRFGTFTFPFDWRVATDSYFQQQLAELGRYADLAAELGLTRSATWVLPQTLLAQIRTESTTARSLTDGAARERDRLREIARVLSSRCIQLGIEIIGVPSFRDARGEIPCFDHNPSTHRHIGLDEFGTNVGWVIDSFHAYASGGRAPHDENTLVSDLICVHVSDIAAGQPQDPDQLNDRVRGLPGETGLTGVPQLLDRLARAGYVGPVTSEPWSSPAFFGKSPNSIASLVAQSLRLAWPEGVPGAPIPR